MNTVSTIGLDVARKVQVHGADGSGAVVFRKRLRRSSVLQFFALQPQCTAAIGACAGSHYWGREIARLGHDVQLIPPSYVKPFVKRQKDDEADVRQSAKRHSDRQCDSCRSRAKHLRLPQSSFGLAISWCSSARKSLTPCAVIGRLWVSGCEGTGAYRAVDCTSDGSIALSAHLLDEKLAVLDAEIARRAEEDEDPRRLTTIPGIGPRHGSGDQRLGNLRLKPS